ncbi:MAG: hypothetical protein P8172_08015 [Gammaproteobacteria bacterium]|jgi:hypothetical protein
MNPANIRTLVLLALTGMAFALSGCATTTADCSLPRTASLDVAMEAAEARLADGCEAEFDRYYAELLEIAEGDPGPENKRRFSEFLLAATDRGLLSTRQAERAYNRYFNVKYVSLMGDYNNCAYTCPRKRQVLTEMEAELLDKERGLLRVSQDAAGYYRADRLFQETELVLEATCTACGAP